MKTIQAGQAVLPRTDWLKRAGLAGTLFFFVKGCLWIIVPVLLAWFGGNGG